MVKQAESSSEFARGWPVLFACLIGVACGASPIPFNTIGFFMPEFHREFGWGYGEISLGVTIYGVLGALLAPLFGAWADRYGARRVALISLTLFGLAFGLFAFTPSGIWGFYTIWIVVGLVGIGSTPVSFSRLVNQWYFNRRGLALAIMLLGTSLAAVVLPRLVPWAIDAYGWRSAHLVVAALPLLVALPLGLLLLREPKAEEGPAAGASSQTLGVPLSAALRDRRFWIMWVSILMVALAYGGAHIHMPEIVKLKGFPKEHAQTAMQVIGLAILCGRLGTGFLLDRFWAPAVCVPILSLPAIACLILADGGTGFGAVLFGAFLLGFAAGAESDLIAYLASRYFGLSSYGKIYGMLYMAFGIASAVSPFLYGTVRDSTGGYAPMLHVAALLFVGGALLLLTLGKYPEPGSPGD